MGAARLCSLRAGGADGDRGPDNKTAAASRPPLLPSLPASHLPIRRGKLPPVLFLFLPAPPAASAPLLGGNLRAPIRVLPRAAGGRARADRAESRRGESRGAATHRPRRGGQRERRRSRVYPAPRRTDGLGALDLAPGRREALLRGAARPQRCGDRAPPRTSASCLGFAFSDRVARALVWWVQIGRGWRSWTWTRR